MRNNFLICQTKIEVSSAHPFLFSVLEIVFQAFPKIESKVYDIQIELEEVSSLALPATAEVMAENELKLGVLGMNFPCTLFRDNLVRGVHFHRYGIIQIDDERSHIKGQICKSVINEFPETAVFLATILRTAIGIFDFLAFQQFFAFDGLTFQRNGQFLIVFETFYRGEFDFRSLFIDKGYHLVSDQYILLRQANRRFDAQAFPSSAFLTSGTMSDLVGIGMAETEAVESVKSSVAETKSRPDNLYHSATEAWPALKLEKMNSSILLFPENWKGTGNYLKPQLKSRTLELLLQQSTFLEINKERIRKRFEVLAALSRQSQSYRLFLSDSTTEFPASIDLPSSSSTQ